MLTPSITKKVRMDPASAKRLARLARKLGMSESDVLREGVETLARMQARKEHIHELIELADVGREEKIRFELR